MLAGSLPWILLLAGCSSAPGSGPLVPTDVRARPASTRVEDGGTDVALREVRALPLVEVRIDGRGPVLAVVDTGAAVTVVSRRLAETLGADRVDRAEGQGVRDAHGRAVEVAAVVRDLVLGVGGTEFDGLDAVVLDLAASREHLDPAVDAILGIGVFADVVLTLDYPGRRLRLEAASLPSVDGRDVLALRWLPGNLPAVDASVASGTHRLLVDSGSSFALTVPPGAASAFAVAPGSVRSGRGTSLSGTTESLRVGRLEGVLRLGSHEIVEPPVLLAGQPSLGGRILREFTVSIDPGGERIRLRRGARGSIRLDDRPRVR